MSFGKPRNLGEVQKPKVMMNDKYCTALSKVHLPNLLQLVQFQSIDCALEKPRTTHFQMYFGKLRKMKFKILYAWLMNDE